MRDKLKGCGCLVLLLVLLLLCSRVIVSCSGSDGENAGGNQQEQAVEQISAEEKRIRSIGYTNKQAKKIYSTLKKVGISEFEFTDDTLTSKDANKGLYQMRVICNGHQTNLTTDDGVLFNVTITGFESRKYGLHQTWTGKIEYGDFITKTQYDLLTSDGYQAYYDAEEDIVIPWAEHKK